MSGLPSCWEFVMILNPLSEVSLLHNFGAMHSGLLRAGVLGVWP